MNDQEIKFNTAKLAKQKGFRTRSKFWYFKRDGQTVYTNKSGDLSGKEDTVKIVTQTFLQKWLRKKHNLHIEITVDFYIDGINYNYQILEHISNEPGCHGRSTGKYGDNGEFNTYEKALEKGLQQALKLIKY